VKEKKCKDDIPKGQIDSRRNDFFYRRKGRVKAERSSFYRRKGRVTFVRKE